MVAHKEKEIKASHKEKTWKYIAAFTGISFVTNLIKKGPLGMFSGDDDDLDA